MGNKNSGGDASIRGSFVEPFTSTCVNKTGNVNLNCISQAQDNGMIVVADDFEASTATATGTPRTPRPHGWARNTTFMQKCITLSNSRTAVITESCPKEIPAVLVADAASPNLKGVYAEFQLEPPKLKDIKEDHASDAHDPEGEFCLASIGFTDGDAPFEEVWGFGPGTVFLGRDTEHLPNFKGFPWNTETIALYVPKDYSSMCLFADGRLVYKTIFNPDEEIIPSFTLLKAFVCVELCPLNSVIKLKKKDQICHTLEVTAMLEDSIDQTGHLCGIKPEDLADTSEPDSPILAELTEETLNKTWTCRICDRRNPCTVRQCTQCNRVPMNHVFSKFERPKSGAGLSLSPAAIRGGYANFLDDISPSHRINLDVQSYHGFTISESALTIEKVRRRQEGGNCYRDCSWGQKFGECF